MTGTLVIVIGCIIFLSLFLHVKNVNSLFNCRARLWNSLSAACSPLTYNINGFESKVNRHLLSLGSFFTCFSSSYVFNIFVLLFLLMLCSGFSILQEVNPNLKKEETVDIAFLLTSTEVYPSIKPPPLNIKKRICAIINPKSYKLTVGALDTVAHKGDSQCNTPLLDPYLHFKSANISKYWHLFFYHHSQ